MKNILKIFIDDLKRIIKSPVTIAILVGLMFIPGIYAWLNIDSNWNPYENTGNLPVAIVNEDEGYELLGSDINIGDSLVETLQENDSMSWQFMDYDEAVEKVKSGDCYGAIIIPKEFSSKLSTLFDGTTIEKPKFDFLVNQKKNAIAPIIVNKAITTIQTSLNDAFVNAIVYKVVSSAEYSNVLTEGTSTTTDVITKLNKLKTIITNLQTIMDLIDLSADTAKSSLNTMNEMLPTLNAQFTDATSSLSSINDLAKQYKAQGDAVASNYGVLLSAMKDVIQSVMTTAASDPTQAYNTLSSLEEVLKNVNTTLQGYQSYMDITSFTKLNNEAIQLIEAAKAGLQSGDMTAVNTALTQLLTKVTEINTYYTNTLSPALDNLFNTTSNQITSLTSLVSTLNTKLGQSDSVLNNMIKILDNTKGVTSDINELLDSITTDIDNIIKTLGGATESELYLKLVNLLQNDANDIADFISEPIETNEIDYYSVESYGAKMSPFYSVLAAWVGCTLLVAIVRTNVKNTNNKYTNFKAYQLFFGRYMLFALLATLQGLIIGIGDLIIGINVVNIPLFLLTLMISSWIFILIVYTLTISFGKVGEALAIVLMVFQVAGSGGTYPIELLPRFFQIIQPFMPFYPAMNALRETLGGFYGSDYIIDIVQLLGHMILPLLIGLVLRRPIIAAKEGLTKKLEKTDLMV